MSSDVIGVTSPRVRRKTERASSIVTPSPSFSPASAGIRNSTGTSKMICQGQKGKSDNMSLTMLLDKPKLCFDNIKCLYLNLSKQYGCLNMKYNESFQ